MLYPIDGRVRKCHQELKEMREVLSDIKNMNGAIRPIYEEKVKKFLAEPPRWEIFPSYGQVCVTLAQQAMDGEDIEKSLNEVLEDVKKALGHFHYRTFQSSTKE